MSGRLETRKEMSLPDLLGASSGVDQSVRQVPQCGQKRSSTLARYGIHTIRDLLRASPATVPNFPELSKLQTNARFMLREQEKQQKTGSLAGGRAALAGPALPMTSHSFEKHTWFGRSMHIMERATQPSRRPRMVRAIVGELVVAPSRVGLMVRWSRMDHKRKKVVKVRRTVSPYYLFMLHMFWRTGESGVASDTTDEEVNIKDVPPSTDAELLPLVLAKDDFETLGPAAKETLTFMLRELQELHRRLDVVRLIPYED